jgi:hypothetical protein
MFFIKVHPPAQPGDVVKMKLMEISVGRDGKLSNHLEQGVAG